MILPLSYKDKGINLRSRIKDKIKNFTRIVLSDRSSRNLFFFLSLNLSFAFVELFYGIITNSLGLISDAFHMFFDSTGLIAGLIAAVITKWKPNDKFTYGFLRAEVLAGFMNGICLLFIGFYIFSEAIERLIETPEIKHERLLVVSILGLIVNIIGIAVFHHGGHGHSHNGYSHKTHGHSHNIHDSHGHSHKFHDNHGHSHKIHDNHGHSHNSHTSESKNIPLIFDRSNSYHLEMQQYNLDELNTEESQIIKGVFLHILADTLGSLGVILSTFLMQQFGWMKADPICSMFISCLIILSVLTLIRDSVYILMQRQPKELDESLPQCYQKLMQLDGVFSVQEPHFWTLCTNVYVGDLKMEVSKNADYKQIMKHAQMIFSAIGVNHLYVQLDPVFM